MRSAVIVSLLMVATPVCVFSQQKSHATIRPKVALKAESFPLTEVRLLDSPFRDAMLRDQKFLLSLDNDRLLHSFRLTAGLPSTAKPYGGWEAPNVELRGHSLGHFLSALALMYSSTGDARFKSKGTAIVAELAKIQQALAAHGFHAGYLSAFPEEFFDRVDARKQVWAPYYTLHKIMAGLLDQYQLCDNQQALDVLVKLADWVKFRVDRLTEEQQQAALNTEFGGMNEVLTNLYAVTGDAEYLRIAEKFDHQRIFDPLARGEDPLNGVHANTQIPKAIGAAREYEMTGDERYEKIASTFWERVAHHRSYVIGGNSDGEAFFPPETFSRHLGSSSTESCNTYNMLKLTRHLFEWEPSAETMDFYERGLYNHILASQDPATGMMTYYVPLRPGAFKTFSKPEESFWCCVGTGMENHAKYGDTIYFHNDTSLYINLFIASELNWKDKGLTVRQDTSFPESDTTRLTFKARRPVKLALRIRYPSWAQSGITVTVNGRKQSIDGKPRSYITVERVWRTGDIVQVRLPMSLHTESMPDDPKLIALLYGPIVLAGDFGNDGLNDQLRYGPLSPQFGRVPRLTVPAFVNDESNLLRRIKPGAAPLTFHTEGLGKPSDVSLVPFYKLYDHRYTVYWKVYSSAEWAKHVAELAAIEARRKEIETATVDFVKIGDAQNERDHNLKGEKIFDGDFEGQHWREAREGGWFSYDLKVDPTKAMTLVLRLRGTDNQRRNFEILVDGEKIGSNQLGINIGEFFDAEYKLPESLIRGKQSITIRFQAPANGFAGGVYDVRLAGL